MGTADRRKPPGRGACLVLSYGRDREADAVAEALSGQFEVIRCTSAGGREGFDRIRTACAGAKALSVAAFDGAGRAALALAVQRSVDRIALVTRHAEPALLQPEIESGERRLARFVRRNLALCAADILCIGLGRIDRRFLRSQLGERCLLLSADTGSSLWRECEDSVKNAICAFLQSPEPAKSLAQNSEMCIIYK